ncbi:hypothetical protein RZN05_04960 [Sphingomonas sp. HF-S4]|uniref:Uncharacterized protein n=1 Tax=Sphingomonas agrestis TaxID=3080540 RepID=A0ABU3Y4N9_9SPHN|nr:hypothetical protein [Sphingomonas sp. HF-S4]MDV3456324.1 hypothetical protein [Sphingomonas sp. HF-S4]
MAVVINEFEAISAPGQEKPEEKKGGDGAPQRIEPAQLRPPLRRIAQRHARLRAH